MWTPRPVRPLRYAGSVATSVLPSPVAISAILPSWRTIPPISWTSKGRMPTVRRAASRATANASGSSASTDSPASRRFLNSSVFARSSASPSAWTDGSSAFVASTVGIMRLTSRSCLVPKIFRRIASIITIDYGISRDSRPPFARSGRAEQLARVAARRHARERPHVLARIGREPELDPLEPPGRHPLELRPFQPDPEVGALHAERAQLPLHGGPQTLRRGPPPLGERRGRLPELGLELAEPPLLGREDLLVAREPVELGDDLVAELEHRLLGIAVFPLEARERVEPLVDRLQAGGLERHRLAERSDRREGVFELRPSRVDRLDGRRHRGIETRQVAEDARRAVEPRGRRLVIVVEERRDLGQTRGELVGVLESSTLLPELLLLARTQARGVELGELEAQEVLALGPVALGGARPLRLGARPEDQQARVVEQRLSGAGFAGQDVEPRAELHGDALDDGEVSDAKLAEHRERC